MSWTAQPLGLDQASSATEGPRAARLAVLHTGSPRGLSEGALGREKAARVKVLKPEWGSRPEQVGHSPGREQSRVWDGWAGEQEQPDQQAYKKG